MILELDTIVVKEGVVKLVLSWEDFLTLLLTLGLHAICLEDLASSLGLVLVGLSLNVCLVGVHIVRRVLLVGDILVAAR